MEKKTTDELRHEIKAATDIEDYLNSNREELALRSLTQYLDTLLSRKGINKAVVDVYQGTVVIVPVPHHIIQRDYGEHGL